jgi:hypothetical protein
VNLAVVNLRHSKNLKNNMGNHFDEERLDLFLENIDWTKRSTFKFAKLCFESGWNCQKSIRDT